VSKKVILSVQKAYTRFGTQHGPHRTHALATFGIRSLLLNSTLAIEGVPHRCTCSFLCLGSQRWVVQLKNSVCSSLAASPTPSLPLRRSVLCGASVKTPDPCRWVPTLVPGLEGENITTVACGWRHSVVVDQAGKIFTFGWGRYGQLGHGDCV